MEKYRIKEKNETFTQEEIAANKNFQRFVTDYKKQARPLSTGRIILGLAVVGVLATVLVMTNNSKQEEQRIPVTEKKPAFVKPPLAGADIPYDSFIVDASSGQDISYKTGTVLHIPANAFLDKDRKPVNGNVTLKYREFHDPADIFLSGIPMTYDSAGTQYHFESAGMMELQAFLGDEPLTANPSALIKVELASRQPGDYFNVYYLDTAARNWTFIERDTAGISAGVFKQVDSLLAITAPARLEKKISNDLLDINRQLAQHAKTKPMLPRKINHQRYQVKIDVRPEEFPELTVYKDVLFEISPLEKDFKPEYANNTWENVIIERAGDPSDYRLTFRKGKEKRSFLCGPVLDEQHYADAKNLFDKLQEKYASILNERRRKKLEKEQQLQYLHDKLKDQHSSLNDSADNANAGLDAVHAKEGFVTRVFLASHFGIWNCDCPSALPQGAIVNAKFIDSTGKVLQLDRACLVQKGKNALFNYYSSSFSEFRYDPKAQNVIWAVTPGNKFAWFPVERFSKLRTVKDTTVFEMKITKKSLSTAMEVKQLMKI